MEELTIEEKAKRYDERLKRAIAAHKDDDKHIKATIERIFPELKESDDERVRKALIKYFNAYTSYSELRDDITAGDAIAWLEKNGEQKQEWKQENTGNLTDFEDAMMHIGGSFFGQHADLDPNDTNAIKEQANLLLELVPKQEWSEEDERIYQSIMDDTVQENQLDDRQTEWLSNIKYRYTPQPKQEWSEDDERILKTIIINIENMMFGDEMREKYQRIPNANKDYYQIRIDWLKSIKDRIQSKPRKKNIEQNLAKKYGITGIGSKHAEGKLGEMIKKKIETENVDNTNKVEPKFKVGDWVVRKDGGVFFNDRKFAQITEIDGEKHWFDTGLISLKAEDMRLWRLEDAKDGDILYSKKHNLLWRYKNTKECYFCMNLNYNSNNISKGDAIVIPNDVKPATKEQRDLLLDKILQQGQHNPTDNGNIENANNDISNDMSNDMPNLKVGDWVIREDGKPFRNGNKFAQIKSIKFDGNMCFLDTGRWLYSSEIRAWSIYDAKPGDVLVASDGSIFIFAGVVDYACKYYVALTLYNGLSINKEVKGGYWETSRAVHPATKEQCDLLFAKMREKGYKYNNEKKEIIRRI